jgi:hypothetical protein
MRPIVVVGTRRPHEILLLAYSAFAGGVYLHSPPLALAAYVPGWEVVVWAVLMLTSGSIGTLAALWWRSVTALRVEAGALVMNTAGLALFVAAVASIIPSGLSAFGVVSWYVRAAGWIVAWGAANLWRAWQIRRDLRGL